MVSLAVGYMCPEVLAFIKALGIPDGVDVGAIDVRIRADEIITATVEFPLSSVALETLASIAERSAGRLVLVEDKADRPTLLTKAGGS